MIKPRGHRSCDRKSRSNRVFFSIGSLSRDYHRKLACHPLIDVYVNWSQMPVFGCGLQTHAFTCVAARQTKPPFFCSLFFSLPPSQQQACVAVLVVSVDCWLFVGIKWALLDCSNGNEHGKSTDLHTACIPSSIWAYDGLVLSSSFDYDVSIVAYTKCPSLVNPTWNTEFARIIGKIETRRRYDKLTSFPSILCWDMIVTMY